MTVTPPQTMWDQRKQAVDRIIRVLAGTEMVERRLFSAGDLAQLRRLDPDHPNRPAFWRLLIDKVPEELRRGEAAETRWAMLMAAMALMAPMHHQHGTHPAAVLAAEHFSEPRVEQFLRANPEHLWPVLRRMSHFLASRGKAVDWGLFAELILAASEESADRARHKFARVFYGALHRANATPTPETTP